jgi:hypothetical protein
MSIESRRNKYLAGALLLAAPFCSLMPAETILTNSPPWNGSNAIIYWGTGQYADPTFGQVITVPAVDTVLQSFTFYVDSSGSPALNFEACVQAWDGVSYRPTGQVLFSASGQAAAANAFVAETFTPNVQLTANTQVVLYFSTLGLANPSTGFGGYGWAYDAGVSGTQDTYPGGQIVGSAFGTGSSSTTSPNGLSSASWGTSSDTNTDSAFIAQFGPSAGVPEPSTFGFSLLMLCGAAGLTWLKRTALARRGNGTSACQLADKLRANWADERTPCDGWFRPRKL